MIVIIEKKVEFDSAACLLRNVQTIDETTISFIQAQLLTLLLNHRGFAVSRNEIFETIFDVHGAHATNNNLNQNISVLRKYLLQLGIDGEVIITVPRVGFMIADNLLIEILQKKPAPIDVNTSVTDNQSITKKILS
ncbi:winged helix-turn-helix domain-containing protein [Citrobacter portucalensis]|uniref:winged helix-turn-helix domain-containing protein n=1 Tax=Citrobacter portucalensis TaxID=1639133 RepID=UPI003C2F78EC